MDQGFEILNQAWFNLMQWHPGIMSTYGMLVASAISTALMMRVAGGIPYVTGAVGFAMMYFSAYLANFLGKHYIITSVTEFQHALVFSFVGQVFGAVLMLIVFKVKDGAAKMI